MKFKSSGKLKCPKCGALFTDIGKTLPCQRKGYGGRPPCDSPILVDACDHELGVFDGKVWHCRLCNAEAEEELNVV